MMRVDTLLRGRILLASNSMLDEGGQICPRGMIVVNRHPYHIKASKTLEELF